MFGPTFQKINYVFEHTVLYSVIFQPGYLHSGWKSACYIIYSALEKWLSEDSHAASCTAGLQGVSLMPPLLGNSPFGPLRTTHRAFADSGDSPTQLTLDTDLSFLGGYHGNPRRKPQLWAILILHSPADIYSFLYADYCDPTEDAWAITSMLPFSCLASALMRAEGQEQIREGGDVCFSFCFCHKAGCSWPICKQCMCKTRHLNPE